MTAVIPVRQLHPQTSVIPFRSFWSLTAAISFRLLFLLTTIAVILPTDNCHPVLRCHLRLSCNPTEKKYSSLLTLPLKADVSSSNQEDSAETWHQLTSVNRLTPSACSQSHFSIHARGSARGHTVRICCNMKCHSGVVFSRGLIILPMLVPPTSLEMLQICNPITTPQWHETSYLYAQMHHPVRVCMSMFVCVCVYVCVCVSPVT